VSHNEFELQPLKTGASRIALGAAVDDDIADVVILPVGLAYDEKARFRSRALVRVGARSLCRVGPTTTGPTSIAPSSP
jgi:1-acyl-sn-glycerol-3-phosphate acyltransferase